MRCDACPVSADRPCLGETPRFAYFCGWAEEGDPTRLVHVVNRSAVAEHNGGVEATGAFPSLMQQARNLAGAVAEAVGSGFEPASPEEQARRLAICGGCPEFVDGRCRQCGCHMPYKVTLAAWHCPIGKW